MANVKKRKARKGRVGRPRKEHRRTGLETTGRAVKMALKRYPTKQGATISQIYKLLRKRDAERKVRRVRTLQSVKLALARAVKRGAIKPPKGWKGFRDVGVTPVWIKNVNRHRHRYHRHPHRHHNRQHRPQYRYQPRGRPAQRKQNVRRKSGGAVAVRRVSKVNRRHSKVARRKSKSVRRKSVAKKKPGMAARPRGRGLSRRRTLQKRKAGGNKAPTNTEETNNSEQSGEQGDLIGLAPIWKAYTCVIS